MHIPFSFPTNILFNHFVKGQQTLESVSTFFTFFTFFTLPLQTIFSPLKFNPSVFDRHGFPHHCILSRNSCIVYGRISLHFNSNADGT